MVKRTLLLALSSDAPDRGRVLARGLAEIRSLRGVKVLEVSGFHGSTAIRSRRGRPLLTAAVRLLSRRTPMGLLIELKRIEVLVPGIAIFSQLSELRINRNDRNAWHQQNTYKIC